MSKPSRETIAAAVAIFREKEMRRQEYEARFGEGRIPLTIIFPDGRRMVAAGDTIYSRDGDDNSFMHWLHDHAVDVIGDEFLTYQGALPSHERHHAIQWADGAVLQFNRAQQSQAKTPATGYFAAWIRLAYDLFTVRDTGGLKEELKTRLLYGKSFQGARHELRVASVCVAAGFSLKYEDDADGSRKHPEFVGTHSTLGYKIAVEAKSRHRFGVNGFIGGKDVPPGKSVGVRDLVLAAYKKDVDVPLYVFVDANLPPSPDAQTSTRWQDEIEKTMMDLAAEGYTDPNPANAVFFTNDPSHYYGNDVVSAGAGDSWTQKFVATTPKWPHPEDDVVARIQKAINTRAAPPSKFFEEAGPLEKAIRAQDRRTEGGA